MTRNNIKNLFLVLLVCVFSMILVCKAYALSIVDRTGRTIEFTRPFHRIISLYPAHTENLFYMGAGNNVVAVSPTTTFPPKALKKPKISYHDDAEKFVMFNPDLVLIRPMIYHGHRKLIDKLESMGITVVSLQPTSVNRMFAYWLDLGRLTGREKAARDMISYFKKEVARIQKIVSRIPMKDRKRVYFESIHRKMTTFSPSAIEIFALKTAGGINIASDARPIRHSNIAQYGKERIIAHARDIDVFLAQRGRMNPISLKRIEEEPGFNVIKAVKEHHVYIIDETIVSRPTMRLLDGIVRIAKILYPERFKYFKLSIPKEITN